MTTKPMTAADVMNPDVLSVRHDMTVRELASFLTANQITGAPVLDHHGKIVGVVSETDIAESELERADSGAEASGRGRRSQRSEEGGADELRGMRVESVDLAVQDIMTPTAYTVPHDTPVPKLAQTMVTGRIHRLLVTRGGQVVGIVTSLDLLKLLYEGS